MKKNSFPNFFSQFLFPISFLGIVSLFSSCERLDMDESLLEAATGSSTDSTFNFNVSLAEAKQFATIVHSSTQKSTSADSIASMEPVVYADDTVMYLVNYYQAGWVIISGDKRTEPILSYSDSTETISLSSANDGVLTWMDEMADAIYQLKQVNPIDTACTGYKLWAALNPRDTIFDNGSRKSTSSGYWVKQLINGSTTTYSVQVGPLLTTKWGQSTPWNQCVPYGDVAGTTRCVTGCVAVATAQLMYWGHYHGGKPSWMFSTGSCNGYSLDEDNCNYSFSFSNPSTTVWDNMAKYYYNSGTYYVAELMGYVGMRLGMDYTKDASGASTDDVPGVFSTFGVTCNHRGYDYTKVCSNISNNVPVYISSYATRKDHKILGIHAWYTYHDGHAWVIDGYQDDRIKYSYTYVWYYVGDTPTSEHYNGEMETNSTTTSTRYFIMNWGWDGNHDSGRFLPSGDWIVSDYNPETNTTVTYNFRYEKEIICDFGF
jgi:hypothetical protein